MNSGTELSDAWQELSRVISRLLTQFPFYGHVLTSLARKMDPKLKYAAGVSIGKTSVLAINPELFFRENMNQRMGLLIHEVEHVIRLHVPRFMEKIRGNPFLKEKANIAMDLAVNCTIDEDLLPLWVLYPRQFGFPDDETAEWYYARLPDVLISPIRVGMSVKEESEKLPSAAPGKLIRDDFDSSDLEDSSGENIPFELEKQIVKEMVKNAVEKTEKLRGCIPGHVQQLIEMLNQESKIPWNVLFRRLCQWASLREKAYSKKRRSRRYGTRPGPYLKRRLRLAVAFDTSGSVSDEDLAWFFCELDHISKKGAEITLIQCDASIQKVERYSRSFKREKPEVYGRGGTAFTPVFEYLLKERSQRPDLLVFFTDGYGDQPEDPKLFPVCWVYTPDHKRAADFGFHIDYNPQQN